MTPSEKGRPDRDEGHRDLLAAIGKAIRLRRVELDMKRSELAVLSGLSYAYVAEIENGTKQASSRALWQLAQALGLEPHELMALAARLEAPERAPAGASLLRTMDPDFLVPLAKLPRASWFHLAPPGISASAAGPTSAPASPAAAGAAGPTSAPAVPTSAFAAPAAAPAADPVPPEGPADPPGLPDVLARVAAALEGIPDERAELALMLTLDERRTRRIVREELDRRRPPG